MSFRFLKQNEDVNCSREFSVHAQFAVKKICTDKQEWYPYSTEREIKLSSTAQRNGDGVNPLYAIVG